MYRSVTREGRPEFIENSGEMKKPYKRSEKDWIGESIFLKENSRWNRVGKSSVLESVLVLHMRILARIKYVLQCEVFLKNEC